MVEGRTHGLSCFDLHFFEFTGCHVEGYIHAVAHVSGWQMVQGNAGHIRKKIEDNPAQPEFIVTVRGVGYRFSGEIQ